MKEKMYVIEVADETKTTWTNLDHKIYSEKDKKFFEKQMTTQREKDNKIIANNLRNALQYVRSAIKLLTEGECEISYSSYPKEYECCELIPLATFVKKKRENVYCFLVDDPSKVIEETKKKIEELENKKCTMNDVFFRFKEIEFF